MNVLIVKELRTTNHILLKSFWVINKQMVDHFITLTALDVLNQPQ